jgi:hypothetical protein
VRFHEMTYGHLLVMSLESAHHNCPVGVACANYFTVLYPYYGCLQLPQVWRKCFKK